MNDQMRERERERERERKSPNSKADLAYPRKRRYTAWDHSSPFVHSNFKGPVELNALLIMHTHIFYAKVNPPRLV
jgi:hypothetical protein